MLWGRQEHRCGFTVWWNPQKFLGEATSLHKAAIPEQVQQPTIYFPRVLKCCWALLFLTQGKLLKSSDLFPPRVLTQWELLGSQWKRGITRASSNPHPKVWGWPISTEQSMGSQIHGNSQPWASTWSTEWLGRTLKTISSQPLECVPNPANHRGSWGSCWPSAGGGCGWQWQSDPSSTATRPPGLTLSPARGSSRRGKVLLPKSSRTPASQSHSPSSVWCSPPM